MRFLRNKLFIAIAIIILVVLFGVWLLRTYLSSVAFSQKLEKIVLDSTGNKIVLSEPLTVESLIANVVVTIPSVVVEHNLPDKTIKLRTKGVTLSIPTLQVISFSTGDVSVFVNKMVAIVSETKGAEVASLPNEKDISIDPNELIDVSKMIRQLIWNIEINDTNVIYRPITGKSKRLRLANTHLGGSSDGLIGASNYHIPGAESQSIQFQLVDQSTEKKFIAAIKLDAENGIDSFTEPLLIGGEILVGEQEISVENLNFKYDRNQLRITSTINIEKQSLNGTINIRRLELSDILLGGTESNKEAEATPRLFNDQKLGIDVLSKFDIDLMLKFGAVRYNNRPIISGDLKAVSSNGNFDVNSNELKILGAPGTFQFLGTSLSSEPIFEIKTKIDQLNLRRFHFDKERGGQPIFTQGLSQFDSYLNFSGNTSKELAGSLSGHINFTTSSGELSGDAVKFVDRSLLSYARMGFSNQDDPEEKKEKIKDKPVKGLPINCINIHMAFDNGYGAADRTIIVETKDNILNSTGYMDFHKESLGYTFTTETQRLIDWSPLSLIKYLEIDGSMANPEFTLNKTEAAKKGIVAAASLVLGPIPSLAYSAIEASSKYAEGKVKCVPYAYGHKP